MWANLGVLPIKSDCRCHYTVAAIWTTPTKTLIKHSCSLKRSKCLQRTRSISFFFSHKTQIVHSGHALNFVCFYCRNMGHFTVRIIMCCVRATANFFFFYSFFGRVLMNFQNHSQMQMVCGANLLCVFVRFSVSWLISLYYDQPWSVCVCVCHSENVGATLVKCFIFFFTMYLDLDL